METKLIEEVIVEFVAKPEYTIVGSFCLFQEGKVIELSIWYNSVKETLSIRDELEIMRKAWNGSFISWTVFLYRTTQFYIAFPSVVISSDKY